MTNKAGDAPMRLRGVLTRILHSVEPLYCIVINLRLLNQRKERKRLSDFLKLLAVNQKKNIVIVIFDLVFKCLLTCATYDDYFAFAFYSKKLSEASKYLTQGRKWKALYVLNPDRQERGSKLLSDKALFNERFSKFTLRDFICLHPGMADAEVLKFLEKHPIFIAKALDGSRGESIELIDSAAFESTEELKRYLFSNNLLLMEERLVNHKDLAVFSRRSLNTVKIGCLRTEHGFKVLFAFLTFSLSDNIMDNLARGGAGCPIDLKTGRLIKGMTNSRMHGTRYAHHPNGFYMLNRSIPFWDKVAEMALEAAVFQAKYDLITWDIAVCPDGAHIIEGDPYVSCTVQLIMGYPFNDEIQMVRRMLRKRHRKSSNGNN